VHVNEGRLNSDILELGIDDNLHGVPMFNKHVPVVLLLPCMIWLTGCAITGPSGKAEIDTWKGATVEELYKTYGTPSKTVKQSDGSKIVEFEHTRPDSSTPYYCTLRYEVDPAGIVASGTAEGNIGGCNHLIKEYKGSP